MKSGYAGWLLGLGLTGCLSAADDFPMEAIDACQDAVCPSDMALVVNDGTHRYAPGRLEVEDPTCLCIDRYEASMGPDGEARSVPATLPWVGLSFSEAVTACAATGKRLCTAKEWTAACAGLPALAYPYGDRFDQSSCNLTGTLLPTGRLSSCEGGWPMLFDLSGNAAEWTGSVGAFDTCDTELGCAAHGGAANEMTAALACGYRAGFSTTSTSAWVGFRCCTEPDAR